MRRMKTAVCGMGVALAGLLAAPAAATVLTFEGADNGGFIPDTYGDYVTGDGVPQAGYGYDMGNGWTPNVAVDTEVRKTNDSGTEVANLNYYASGYATNDVAYADNAQIGEITFTPDPTYAVRINSFRLSVFVDTNTYSADVLRIRDEGRDQILWSTGSQSLNGTDGPATVVIPVNYTGNTGETLRLQFGTDWNIAIDDVNFDQVPIPEPASAMLLLGLAPLVARRRRA